MIIQCNIKIKSIKYLCRPVYGDDSLVKYSNVKIERSYLTHCGVILIKSFSTLSISNNSCIVIPMNYCLYGNSKRLQQNYRSLHRSFSSNFYYRTMFVKRTILLCPSKHTLFFKRSVSAGKKPVGHAKKILDILNRPTSPVNPVKNTVPNFKNIFDIDSNLPYNFYDRVNGSSTGSSSTNSSTSQQGSLSRIFDALVPSAFNNAKKLKGVVTQDSEHVVLHKQSIFEFLRYFEMLDKTNVEDVQFLIRYYRSLLLENPSLYNRAMQLAFETILKKLKLSEDSLKKIFPEMGLIDLIGLNEGLHDQSTLFTLMQTEFLQRQPGFNKNTTVVVATCMRSHDLTNVDHVTKNTMAAMKLATGNSVSDLILDGHYYDYKITTDISLAKNLIVYLDYSYFDTGALSRRHLDSMIKQVSFEYDKNIHLTLDQKNFYALAKVTLNNILDNKILSPLEKSLAWNQFIFKTLHTRPQGIMLPMLVPTTTVPFQKIVLPQAYNNTVFPISKSLDPEPILEYVKEMTKTWSNERKGIAYEVTKGTLGSPTNDNDLTNSE